MREICRHAVWGIALGVHRDHQDLYLLCILRSQSLYSLRDLGESRWTDARAKRVSEIEQDKFALKVAEMDWLAGMGGQRKVGRSWPRLADNAMKDLRWFVCKPSPASAPPYRANAQAGERYHPGSQQCHHPPIFPA